MLGDSITYGGKWAELLGREDIANLGIVGDSTQGFIDRLPQVYRRNPRIVFIMGGVNDIAGGTPVEVVFTNIRLIVQSLRVRHIIPVVQSTLYTRIRRFNPRIERLNKMLDRYSQKYHVEYIDVNAVLSSNKLLQRKYTFDGIHLRPPAYEEWRRVVANTIGKYKIPPAVAVAAPAPADPKRDVAASSGAPAAPTLRKPAQPLESGPIAQQPGAAAPLAPAASTPPLAQPVSTEPVTGGSTLPPRPTDSTMTRTAPGDDRQGSPPLR
jgi:lysophospholipase L1-like esterase